MRFDLPPDLVATALQLLQAHVTVAVDAQLDALVARAGGKLQRLVERERRERGGADVHGARRKRGGVERVRGFMVPQSAQPPRTQNCRNAGGPATAGRCPTFGSSYRVSSAAVTNFGAMSTGTLASLSITRCTSGRITTMRSNSCFTPA